MYSKELSNHVDSCKTIGNANNQLKYLLICSKKVSITTFELFFEDRSANSTIYDMWELQIQSFLIIACLLRPIRI